MRIELIPLIIGGLMALIGVGLVADAWTPDEVMLSPERRRRKRAERSRGGEAMLGFGVLAMAAAFIGRDTWRYSIIAVIVGTLLLLIGAVMNGRYLREMFVYRGPLRRGDGREANAPYEIPDRAKNEPRNVQRKTGSAPTTDAATTGAVTDAATGGAPAGDTPGSTPPPPRDPKRLRIR